LLPYGVVDQLKLLLFLLLQQCVCQATVLDDLGMKQTKGKNKDAKTIYFAL